MATIPPHSTAELADVIGMYPVEEGIAEVLSYLALNEDDIRIDMHDDEEITIDYTDPEGIAKRTRLPRVTVTRA